MKKTVLTIIISVILSLGASTIAIIATTPAEPKIFTADIQKIQTAYVKFQESNENLKSFSGATAAKIAEMNKELEALAKQIAPINEKLKQTDDADLRAKITKDELAPLLAKFQQQRAAVEKFMAEGNANLKDKVRDTLAEIRLDIRDAAAAVAKEKNADYLFEQSGMFFAKSATDITDEVIARLNAPKKTD